MKLFDTQLSDGKQVEAWVSCGQAELLFVLPLWFPRRAEWKVDFGRFLVSGIRQMVICFRVVNRATHWMPAFSACKYWREIRIDRQEYCQPQTFEPSISMEQAVAFGGMDDDALSAMVNNWDRMPPTIKVEVDGKTYHAHAADAEKKWLSAWSNPSSCQKFLEALGFALRQISRRSGDGSIVYEVCGKAERSYVWRTDEFRQEAFLPGIRWALAMRCENTPAYAEVRGKKFISVRCKHCGETEDWVYNVPSYGFLSFSCSKCARTNSWNTQKP